MLIQFCLPHAVLFYKQIHRMISEEDSKAVDRMSEGGNAIKQGQSAGQHDTSFVIVECGLEKSRSLDPTKWS